MKLTDFKMISFHYYLYVYYYYYHYHLLFTISFWKFFGVSWEFLGIYWLFLRRRPKGFLIYFLSSWILHLVYKNSLGKIKLTTTYEKKYNIILYEFYWHFFLNVMLWCNDNLIVNAKSITCTRWDWYQLNQIFFGFVSKYQ